MAMKQRSMVPTFRKSQICFRVCLDLSLGREPHFEIALRGASGLLPQFISAVIDLTMPIAAKQVYPQFFHEPQPICIVAGFDQR